MDCTYFIFCFETTNPVPESWGAWRSRSANRQLGERGEHPQLGSGAPEVRSVCKIFHRHRSRSATSRDKMTDDTVRRCDSHFINECKDSRLSGDTGEHTENTWKFLAPRGFFPSLSPVSVGEYYYLLSLSSVMF